VLASRRYGNIGELDGVPGGDLGPVEITIAGYFHFSDSLIQDIATALAAPGQGVMKDVWIAQVAMTRFGKRPESLQDLMADAALEVLKNSSREPDALVVTTMSPEEFIGEGNFASQIASYIGCAQVPAIRVETATSSGAAALYAGFAMIASGLHHTVLVLGGEKMTHLPTPRVSQIISRVMDPQERLYGATMPALAAICTRAALADGLITPIDMARVAVKNHANGARNPYAHFQHAITVNEVMNSRVVADPLRLKHCCPISDGAAAVILTAEPTGVKFAGIGHGSDLLAVRHRESLTTFRATQAAAKAAFQMAGFGPERIQVAEIHDAFTPFELLALEDIGLFRPGQAANATGNGETALNGRLPVNPSGGLKARGHALAATGLAQAVEIVWQLTGQAHNRQVQAQVGLAHSIGGMATNNWVSVLQRVA
jgi:acetyl-CoA C-acetyltransferase